MQRTHQLATTETIKITQAGELFHGPDRERLRFNFNLVSGGNWGLSTGFIQDLPVSPKFPSYDWEYMSKIIEFSIFKVSLRMSRFIG